MNSLMFGLRAIRVKRRKMTLPSKPLQFGLRAYFQPSLNASFVGTPRYASANPGDENTIQWDLLKFITYTLTANRQALRISS